MINIKCMKTWIIRYYHTAKCQYVCNVLETMWYLHIRTMSTCIRLEVIETPERANDDVIAEERITDKVFKHAGGTPRNRMCAQLRLSLVFVVSRTSFCVGT